MTYSFAIEFVVHGSEDLASALERVGDALFDAGLDDGLVSGPAAGGDVWLVEVEREASGPWEALTGAVTQVLEAGCHPVGVRVEDLVSASEIAARVGKTRQAVDLWVKGKRGPGGFPAPAFGRKERWWHWSEVRPWLEKVGEELDSGPDDDILARMAAVLTGDLARAELLARGLDLSLPPEVAKLSVARVRG